jgi:hypothetical protein
MGARTGYGQLSSPPTKCEHAPGLARVIHFKLITTRKNELHKNIMLLLFTSICTVEHVYIVMVWDLSFDALRSCGFLYFVQV